MTEQAPAAADTAAAKKPQIVIQRLYVKDISFESPGTPAVFTQPWEPETNVQFGSGVNRVSDNQYEVVLQVTVTATLKGKTAYIAEVRYAGVFQVDGIDGAALEHTMNAYCPNILFPYVREVITDLIARGTYPQFILQPINFDAVYADAKRRQQAEAEAAQQAPTH